MAEITQSAGSYLRPWRNPLGGPFPITHRKQSTGGSSLIIRIGTVLGLDPNSTVYADCVVPSSQTSNTIVSTAIVGVAAEGPGAVSGGIASGIGSTNTQGTLIPIWEANPHMEFMAYTRNGALASTLVGTPRDLLWDSTNFITLVNSGASSLSTPLNTVIVTELIDNIGDTGGRVAFRFCVKDPLSSLSTGCRLAFFR